MIVVALTVLLVGCGSTDSDEGSGESSTTEAPAAESTTTSAAPATDDDAAAEYSAEEAAQICSTIQAIGNALDDDDDTTLDEATAEGLLELVNTMPESAQDGATAWLTSEQELAAAQAALDAIPETGDESAMFSQAIGVYSDTIDNVEEVDLDEFGRLADFSATCDGPDAVRSRVDYFSAAMMAGEGSESYCRELTLESLVTETGARNLAADAPRLAGASLEEWAAMLKEDPESARSLATIVEIGHDLNEEPTAEMEAAVLDLKPASQRFMTIATGVLQGSAFHAIGRCENVEAGGTIFAASVSLILVPPMLEGFKENAGEKVDESGE